MMFFKFIKPLFPLIVILGFVLLAGLPLFRSGFIPTHDGEYHIIRFYEFEKALRSNYWFPRWAPGLNSGYGVPLFNFHYPLPNYLGALFHSLGWSLTDSFKLTLAVGYFLACFSCFFWLEKLFRKTSALAGTVIFAYIPYWFVDIYIRGAVGEVLAIAFLMLALASIEKNWKTVFAFAAAGMILSHNILALIFLPVVIGYLLIRGIKDYWLSLVLGIGLSTYFWLPALIERDMVVGLNTVNFHDYFPELYQLLIPAWGGGFATSSFSGNEMSPQIGVIPLTVIVFSLVFLRNSLANGLKKIRHYFLLLIGMAFILMQKISIPIWEKLPLISYMQYPWRLLSVFLPTTAFLTATVVEKKRKFWLTVALMVVAVALGYGYSRPAIYLPRNDNYYLTRKEFTDGTSSLGNSFSTRWSTWKDQRPDQRLEVVKGKAQVTMLESRPLRYSFSLQAFENSVIKINILYYPGWTLVLDEKQGNLVIDPSGGMTFAVSPGTYSGRVFFGETASRLMADLVSLVSLFWIMLSVILKANYAYCFRRYTFGKRP